MTHMPPLLTPALARLHRDECGTTITEFVVVLPVFVLIFSATLALSKTQHIGIQTQIEASSQMWERAIAAQTDTSPEMKFMSAQEGSTEALAHISQRAPLPSGSPHPTQAYMEQRWNAAASAGHMGDAKAMLDPIQSYMPSNFGLDSYGKLHSAHTRYGESTMTLTDTVGALFDPSNPAKAGFNLLNDASSMASNKLRTTSVEQAWSGASIYPLLDSTRPEGTIYNSATSLNGMGASRLAVATGTRYGTALGTSKITVVHPLLPHAPELSAGFDTLIAPKAQQTDEERARTIYTSQMTLMNETLYSTLLGIEYDENFRYEINY